MSYTETLAAFASATETTILALHARYETGEITGAQFVALAAAALIRAGAQGAALADMALSASLSVQRKRPGPALGLTLPDDAPVNTRAAVADTLNGEPYRLDPLAAAAVLGRAEASHPQKTPTGPGWASTASAGGRGYSMAARARCARTSPDPCCPRPRRCTTTKGVDAPSNQSTTRRPP